MFLFKQGLRGSIGPQGIKGVKVSRTYLLLFKYFFLLVIFTILLYFSKVVV